MLAVRCVTRHDLLTDGTVFGAIAKLELAAQTLQEHFVALRPLLIRSLSFAVFRGDASRTTSAFALTATLICMPSKWLTSATVFCGGWFIRKRFAFPLLCIGAGARAMWPAPCQDCCCAVVVLLASWNCLYCAHVLLRTCDIDDSACFMLLLLQVFFDVRERIVARIVLWSAGWRVMHMMPARALRVE